MVPVLGAAIAPTRPWPIIGLFVAIFSVIAILLVDSIALADAIRSYGRLSIIQSGWLRVEPRMRLLMLLVLRASGTCRLSSI